MGLFSFIGGLLGAGAQKHAISQATNAQVDAYNKGIGEQHREFDLARSDFAPYMGAGTSALDPLESLLGLKGVDASQAQIAALKDSPLYQSLYNNGQEAVLQNASATGGIRGGNTQGALADFGRDTLSSVIQNQIGNLGSLVGLGEGATNSVTGFNQQETNNITSLLSNIGGAKASGYLGKGGLTAGMWNSTGQFLDQVASAVAGGMGGGGGMGGAGGGGGMPSFLSQLF